MVWLVAGFNSLVRGEEKRDVRPHHVASENGEEVERCKGEYVAEHCDNEEELGELFARPRSLQVPSPVEEDERTYAECNDIVLHKGCGKERPRVYNRH